MRSSKPAQQIAISAAIIFILYLIFQHADFGYDFHWAILYEVNPTYKEIFGYWLLKGLVLTVEISLISAVIALILGTIFGIARLSQFKPVYYFSTAYVEFFRNTPLLVQLFFWYFAFPLVLPDPLVEFFNEHHFEFWAATFGLSIYTASFVAEIVRAGIQAISHGHLEAAFSSGLSWYQTLRFVILPQAFRIIIPPLGSEFLNNMKNSSLAMTIGVAELCWQSQQIESFTFRGFEATSAASIIYLSLSLAISLVMNSINHHLQVGQDRKLSLFDRALFALFNPFVLMGKSVTSVLAWGRKAFGKVKSESPSENSVYLSPWSRFIALLSKGVVYGWKSLFVVFFAGLVALVGLIIFKFNWHVIWKSIPSLLFWTFPHGGKGEIFFGLGGLSLSILLAGISLFVSFFIGLVCGLGRLSKNTLLSTTSILYIEIIRGNPLIMVIFWVYFFSPILTGMQIDVFWSATIAFTIFSGAYLAEIVRAGVSAIPEGQIEASKASGLNYFQTMRCVVLPQALKLMIPAFVGQFIALFKDTSLAYIIGVFELTTIAQTLNNRLMIYPFEIYTTIAVLYFICCYSMSMVARHLEIKYSPDRRVETPRMA